eukprot:1301643-Rhodomonas_salina.1
MCCAGSSSSAAHEAVDRDRCWCPTACYAMSGTDIMYGTAGFCGSFTTFSTFSVDTVQMMQAGQARKAIAYVMVNNVMGIGAAGAGMMLFAGKLKP